MDYTVNGKVRASIILYRYSFFESTGRLHNTFSGLQYEMHIGIGCFLFFYPLTFVLISFDRLLCKKKTLEMTKR